MRPGAINTMRFLFSLLVVFLLQSCCPVNKNLFVLMPDPDGTTGIITVTNQGGTQVIDKPGQVTTVTDIKTPPAPPVPIDEKEISRIFGAAILAQPPQPVTFILNFKTGTADLTEDSAKKIPDIVAAISQRNSSDISVVGHSDTVGSKQRNYQISLNRALRMRDILVSLGVDRQAIATESHGEDNPLINTGDEVEEVRNRRVEVTVR